MKRYNVSVPKEGKDGKTYWSNVGALVWFQATEGKNDSFILELNMFPNTKFGVFEQKPKADKDDEKFHQSLQKPPEKVRGTDIDYPTEEINPEDIPF